MSGSTAKILKAYCLLSRLNYRTEKKKFAAQPHTGKARAMAVMKVAVEHFGKGRA